MVLHNLKTAHEGKLVKMIELRDLDMLSVTTFMGTARLWLTDCTLTIL